MEELNITVSNENQNTSEITEAQMNELYNYALAQRYKQLTQIVRSADGIISSYFKKGDVHNWLQRPIANERRLRDASKYLYEASGQYKRLCNYQPNMLKMSHVISPTVEYPTDNKEKEEYKRQYKITAKRLDGWNIKTEFRKLLNAASREGVAYGYVRENSDVFRIHILDANYCRMAYIDASGCIRFEFNFSYFNKIANANDRIALLESYGQEFIEKYEKYSKNGALRWQEIGEDGICVKYNEEILEYTIPPYIAVLDMLFDLEDYKSLNKAREESGNYNLLGFQIPVNKDGKILMDLEIAKKFIAQASSEIPSTIGVLLSPMEIQKINFAKESSLNNRNAVTDAEEQFWNASGVSELLFGASKSSANALTKSIIADEIDIFPLVRQIERWINRRLRSVRGKYKFKIKFLDITYFNDSDKFDTFLKAGNSGVPVKNAISATLGYTPYETLMMAELENNAFNMRETVYGQPLKSANTMSSNDDEGGRPEMDEDKLSPSGEATRVNEGNDRGD